ncbi:MAG: HEAT repeat domain-containing protein, partial [Candidatus Binatia bacterium]
MGRIVIVTVLALAVFGETPALAHFAERTDSLWGFVSRSDVVVIGTVVRAQRLEEDGHTMVPGAVRVHVDERLRGETGSGEMAILIEGAHQPVYATGERVLVFAERRDGVLRSLQSRFEKISADAAGAPVVSAVRRYLEIADESSVKKRAARLKSATLALLGSRDPRLHQDAVFDLNRSGLLDGALSDHDLASLGRLALEEATPLVVREGIAAKLGALSGGGRDAATAELTRLALRARNPAARVATLNALARSRRAEAIAPLAAAIDAPDRFVRLAAVEGLGALGARSAVTRIVTRLEDPDGRVA